SAAPEWRLSALGANQRLRSHFANASLASGRVTLKGRRLCGRMSRVEAPSTISAVPQNAHASPVTLGPSVVSAPQFEHVAVTTSTVSAWPARWRTVASKSSSSITTSAAATSFSVPQYGQRRWFVPGAKTRSAPHRRQGNWRTSIGSGRLAGGRRRGRRGRHRGEEGLERRHLAGGLPAVHAVRPYHRLPRERAALRLGLQRLEVVRPARLAVHRDVVLHGGRGGRRRAALRLRHRLAHLVGHREAHPHAHPGGGAAARVLRRLAHRL